MKIYTTIDSLIGKKAHKDKRLEILSKRFASKKVTPIGLEFVNTNREACDCIVGKAQERSDFIVYDYDRATDCLNKNSTNKALSQAVAVLEKENPLFGNLSPELLGQIKEFAFITARPFIVTDKDTLDDDLAKEILRLSGRITFFTAGEKETRAWMLEQGMSAVDAAGKIHTDLARGFIRAEVYNVKDVDQFKNTQEGIAKGLLKIVGKEYTVADGDVITIKFNV